MNAVEVSAVHQFLQLVDLRLLVDFRQRDLFLLELMEELSHRQRRGLSVGRRLEPCDGFPKLLVQGDSFSNRLEILGDDAAYAADGTAGSNSVTLAERRFDTFRRRQRSVVRRLIVGSRERRCQVTDSRRRGQGAGLESAASFSL